MKNTCLFLAALLLCHATPSPAQYQTLNDPLGAAGTLALGVSGVNIVGSFSGDNDQGFLYNGSGYTPLNDAAGGSFTIAAGVSGGTVVGWYTDGAQAHGFLYANGSFTTLDNPAAAAVDSTTSIPPGGYGFLLFDSQFDGWGGTFASGISGGNIVGWYVDADGNTHGFVYNGSSYQTLDDPDAAGATFAQGIDGNNIVGYYVDAGGNNHGFLYDGSRYTTLDAPGASRGSAYGTFAQGVSGGNIVGWYVNDHSGDHGFIYNGSSYTTLDVPGALGGGSTFAQGVSGNSVVGWYIDPNGGYHGFSYAAALGAKYSISLSASPSADGRVSGVGSFPAGASRTVVATPNSGFDFANWTSNGVVVSSSSSYTFTLNDDTTLVANFVPEAAGALQVTITPEPAVTDGAKWSVDGGVFQLSGAIVANLSVGTHTVSFKTIPGYVTPPSERIAVAANATTMTNGVYVVQTGSLEVTLGPAGAVEGGAQWQVDFNNTNLNSGVILSNLPVGSHTVVFRGIDDWTAPSNHTVTIRANSRLKLSANYLFNGPGIYNGLFMQSFPTEATSGSLSLNVTDLGSYTGKILVANNPSALSYTGNFDAIGRATNKLKASAALGYVTIQLNVNWNNTPVNIGGTVSGTNSGGWNSPLLEELAVKQPAAEYTAILLPSPTPPGTGFMLVTNNQASGEVTFKVYLPDGTTFSDPVPWSGPGYIPLFNNTLYGNTGMFLGWVSAQTNALSDNLYWIRPASRSGLFTNGFTNQTAIQGWLWTNPAPHTAAVALPDGQLTVSGGGLAGSLTFNVAVSNNNALVKMPGGATNSLTGSITPATGLLTITVGSGSAKITGSAAVLQYTTNAAGFFVTKTNGGTILLQP